jgi:chromosome segregation ATPase
MDYLLDAIIGFAGIGFGWWLTRGKSNAETQKLLAEAKKVLADAKKTDIETQVELQEQINAIWDKLKNEREAYEKKIEDLNAKNYTLSASVDQLKKRVFEKDTRIEQIEKENLKLKDLVHKHGNQIGELRRGVTGQLPPR